MKYNKSLSNFNKELTEGLIDKFNIRNGAKCFSLGIFQNYLVCIPAIKHIKHFHHTAQIYSWKSNGMSEESIENITKSDSILHKLLLIMINYQT